MATNDDLPEFRSKRKVLFGSKTADDTLRETGEEFMRAGRYDDALEFFQRAGADKLADQIAEKAIEAGNVPLLMRARRVSGTETSRDEWTGAAQMAERQGRPSGARLAYERAGQEEDARRMAEQMPGAPEAQPEQVLDEDEIARPGE